MTACPTALLHLRGSERRAVAVAACSLQVAVDQRGLSPRETRNASFVRSCITCVLRTCPHTLRAAMHDASSHDTHNRSRRMPILYRNVPSVDFQLPSSMHPDAPCATMPPTPRAAATADAKGPFSPPRV